MCDGSRRRTLTMIMPMVLIIVLGGCNDTRATLAPAASPKVSTAAPASLVRATDAATRAVVASTQPSPEPTPVIESLAPIPGQVVTNGGRGTRLVALTFDLCATPQASSGFDAKLVETLVDEGAPATFFMGGLWALGHPGEARSLAPNARFELANHGYAHIHPRRATSADMRREILDAQAAIERVTERQPRLFRFPFDEYDDHVVRILGECGLTGVSADVVTGDPDANISAARIADYTVQTARGGSIVLMHANGKGVNTAQALPKLIAGLRSKGYELVTVSELLDEPVQAQDP